MVYDGVETREMLRLMPEPPLSDDEYYDFCAANPDLRIERTSEGEIEIMPPTGFESGYRNNGISAQLYVWAEADGRGLAVDSNTEYLLPDGSARSPDASWVHRSRLAGLSSEQKRKFAPICPDFVVELMSPSDRLSRVQAKMHQWIDNGAQLAWLIDPDCRTVYIYRPGQPPEQLIGPMEVRGEHPVDGFVLALGRIFDPRV